MAVADGFHVDSSGNLWLGSNRETFDATTRSEAPFYVYANGNLVANSGTFSGDISGASGTFTGNLSGSTITGGSINIGNGTFQVDSSGNLTATSASISGVISAGGAAADINNNSTTISGGKITAGTLSVGSADISGQLDFGKLSISSANIISTIADEAIANAKIASGISANKLEGFGQSTSSLVVINASSGLSILNGELNLNNKGISNANDLELNNGSFFNSSGNLGATGYVSTNSSTSRLEMNNSFVYLKPGNSFGLNIGTSNSTVYSNFRPNSNGSKDLGASSLRWATVHRISESSTSDERLKDNIVDLTQGLDFINVLEPKEFTWKSISLGFECDTCGEMYPTDDECTSQIMDEDKELVDCDGTLSEIFTEDTGQKVFGFIAQDMLEHLPNSTDYQLLSHNEDDEYLYSQENLVAPLVKAIQELSAKNDELESRIAVLEG